MGKNKKIREKIESLEKSRQEHLQKIVEYGGQNYTLKPYWEGEIENFEGQIEELKKKLMRK